MTHFKKYAAAVAIAAAVGASSASAAVIMTFSQSSGANTVTGTAVGGTTTIFANGIGVIFGFVENAGSGLVGNLQLNATCMGGSVSGNTLTEHCSGTFQFTSGATNILSGSFIDLLTAEVGSHALTLQASTPPSSDVTFTSSVITTLGLERAISFSLTNHASTPDNGVQLCGTTICSFNASVSGNASAELAQRVPEPATLGLLGVALAGLGFIRRRRQS